MGCITCGRLFNGSQKELMRMYKEDFDTHGIERYVYRMGEKEPFQVVRKKGFQALFPSIKANFSKGAEYFHIQEWTYRKD